MSFQRYTYNQICILSNIQDDYYSNLVSHTTKLTHNNVLWEYCHLLKMLIIRNTRSPE